MMIRPFVELYKRTLLEENGGCEVSMIERQLGVFVLVVLVTMLTGKEC